MLLRMTLVATDTWAAGCSRFNEAGAMLLRMTFPAATEEAGGRPASMRPEQCCSG